MIKKRTLLGLVLTLLLVWMAYAGTKLAVTSNNPLRELKIKAAQRMSLALQTLYDGRIHLGVETNRSMDRNQSGVIGKEYTDITTTLGSLPAKRTAATPDIAAMVVQMLWELGLEQGQLVAVNMSGSFPGLNIAISCAIETMGFRGVYIASVGASSYGANQLDFTYLDMHSILYQQGMLNTPLSAASVGGNFDTGYGMISDDVPQQIIQKIEQAKLPLIYENNLQLNLAQRVSIYENEGEVSAFINIGGNWVGGAAEDVPLPAGILSPLLTCNPNFPPGLIQHFLTKGVQCINLLNIKELALRYGVPFDPYPLPAVGQSAVYVEYK